MQHISYQSVHKVTLHLPYYSISHAQKSQIIIIIKGHSDTPANTQSEEHASNRHYCICTPLKASSCITPPLLIGACTSSWCSTGRGSSTSARWPPSLAPLWPSTWRWRASRLTCALALHAQVGMAATLLGSRLDTSSPNACLFVLGEHVCLPVNMRLCAHVVMWCR